MLVVHIDLSRRTKYEAEAYQWLDTTERARFRKFQSEDARRRFVMCRASLRENMCNIQGCKNEDLRFSFLRQEKPIAFVNGTQISGDFSVSHSIDNGLLAFSNVGRIGADIEDRKMRHAIDGPIREVFSPREQLALDQAGPEREFTLFFRLWTHKEAIIKATGEGFRADTTLFSLPDGLIEGARRSEFVYPQDSNQRWVLVNLENDDFAAAFAKEVLD